MYLKTFQSISDLHRVSERLKTFKGWTGLIKPKELSAAGFVWCRDKETDNTQCFYCKLIIGEWEKNDNPLELHRKYQPKCPMFQKLYEAFEISNRAKPLTLKQTLHFTDEVYVSFVYTTQHEKRYFRSTCARHPSYETFESRMSTFNGWKKVITKETLVEAGFFYCGL